MKRKDPAMPDARQPDPSGAHAAARPRSLAYLISTYPTLSMTFVLREVIALREMGFRIETVSINRPDRPESELIAVEAAEAPGYQ